MYCSKCGADIKPGSKYCGVCGEEQSNQPANIKIKWDRKNFQTKDFAKFKESILAHKGIDFKIGHSKKIIAISGAVVLVLLLILLGRGIFGFYMRNIASPSTYLKYVLTKRAVEYSSNIADIYDRYYLDGIMSIANRKDDIDLTVELGEEGKDYAGLIGLEAISKLNIESKYNAKGNAYEDSFTIGINDEDFLDGKISFDEEDSEVYVQSKSISDKYLFASVQEMIHDYEPFFEYIKSDPAMSKKEAKKLSSKYMRIIIDNIDDVKKEKNEIKASQITQKCNQLIWTIDKDDLKDIFGALKEEVENDSVLEEISEEYEDEHGLELNIYDNIKESLSYIEKEVPDLQIKYCVYIGNDGKVIGDDISLNMDGDYLKYEWLMPRRGNKYAFTLNASLNGQGVELSGSGKGKDNELNGDFDLKISMSGMSKLSVADISIKELDFSKMKKGEFNGEVILSAKDSFGSIFNSLFGMNDPRNLLASAGRTSVESSSSSLLFDTFLDYSLDIKSKTNNKNTSFKATVNNGKALVASIAIQDRRLSASKVTIPSQSDVIEIEQGDEMDAFAEYFSTIKLDKVIKALKKAEGPDIVIEALEEASNYISEEGVENENDVRKLINACMVILFDY